MSFDDATGVGIVAITDHAQSVLGDVVFVELPAVGTIVAQGGECCAGNSITCEGAHHIPCS